MNPTCLDCFEVMRLDPVMDAMLDYAPFPDAEMRSYFARAPQGKLWHCMGCGFWSPSQ